MNSATKKDGRLADALRVKTPTIIYGVDALATVVRALEQAANKALVPVDGRGEVEAAALRSSIDAQAKGGGPVVVLLGTEISDDARAVLTTYVEDEPIAKLVAITAASAPSDAMARLFPLQLAAARALEGAN